MAKICHQKIAALPWVEIRNLLKLAYKKKIQLSRGLKGVIPHGTNRRFRCGIPSLPTPPPKDKCSKFCGKTPLTKAKHE
jgi:hypothetical protein